jgi:tetratricopeptide (TPR) repeat protein
MNRKHIILLLSVALLVNACGKQLNLAPENTLTDKDVFKTEGGTEQALSEAYYDLLLATTRDMSYLLGDVTTPNLLHSAYYNTFTLATWTAGDASISNMWTAYYKAINAANNVIVKIPQFAQFSAGKQQQFIAECRFIRAYAYLDLLKLYGDGALTNHPDGFGLPLQLTPFAGYETGQVIPRSTNAEVYAQIIKDLTESLDALPDNQANDLKTRSRATKGSVNALLARTYLYMRRYADAAAAAKKVLDNNSIYALSTNAQVFPANSTGTTQAFTTEHVFALPFSQIVSSSTSLDNRLGSTYYYKNNYWIDPSFKSSFQPGDQRVSQLMFYGDQNYYPARQFDYTTFKFNNLNGRDNVSLIRLAEVLLTRAESLVKQDNTVNSEAVSLLNKVRNRSLPNATPYTVSSFAGSSALADSIFSERRYELAFEGLYRYDLMRTGKPLHNPDVAEGKKTLPVPQVEIDISKGVIRQNSAY